MMREAFRWVFVILLPKILHLLYSLLGFLLRIVKPQATRFSHWSDRERQLREILRLIYDIQEVAESTPSIQEPPSVIPASSLSRWPWNERLYVPLSHAGKGIRLLFLLRDGSHGIVCRLQNFEDLEQCPPFHALSYTWGEPGSETHEIIINGHLHRVRENLYSFLQYLKLGKSSWSKKADATTTFEQWQLNKDYTGCLWIDALCINQMSDSEKTQQVGLMSQIYKQAVCVLVWFPPHPQDSDAQGQSGLDHEEVMKLCQASKKAIYQELDDDVTEAYLDLRRGLWPQFKVFIQHVVASPYWERVWIIQEITLARDVLLCSGNDAVTWQDFKVYYDSWSANSSPRGSITKLAQQSIRLGNQELPDLIRTFWSSQCSDARDRVFGLLGLETRGRIRADYSLSEEQVLLAMAKTYREFYSSQHNFYDLAKSLRVDDERTLQLFIDTFGAHKLDSPALRRLTTPDQRPSEPMSTGMKRSSRLEQIIQRQAAWAISKNNA